jgi:DNA-binding transcriptional MerR regulator/methanogenic corrinoid protein MtbC1
MLQNINKKELDKMENKLSIKMVSSRSGLSPQLIRTWEKRYGAIEPQRSPTNRRLYSESDLEKLILLKRATTMGLAISTVAQLSIKELYELVDKRDINEVIYDVNLKKDDISEYHLNNCINAIKYYDYAGLESSLLNASSSLGQQLLIEKVIFPLLDRTGDFWMNGEFHIAQEHMVSTIVRSILGSMLVSGKINVGGPTLLVTTPNRQIHELGALMAAVTAMSIGWKVIYLGPNLPVEEIANAIVKHKADALALSITYPTNDSALSLDLNRFRKIIKNEFPIIIGGQGASNYSNMINSIKAIYVKDLKELKMELVKLSSLKESHIN